MIFLDVFFPWNQGVPIFRFQPFVFGRVNGALDLENHWHLIYNLKRVDLQKAKLPYPFFQKTTTVHCLKQHKYKDWIVGWQFSALSALCFKVTYLAENARSEWRSTMGGLKTPTGKTNIKPQAVTFKMWISSTNHKNISGFQNCWSFFFRVKSAPKGQYIHCHQRTGQFEIVTTWLPLQLPDKAAWVICHLCTRLNNSNSYLFFSHSTLPPRKWTNVPFSKGPCWKEVSSPTIDFQGIC